MGQTKKKVQKYSDKGFGYCIQDVFLFVIGNIQEKESVNKTKPPNDGSVIVLLLFSPC